MDCKDASRLKPYLEVVERGVSFFSVLKKGCCVQPLGWLGARVRVIRVACQEGFLEETRFWPPCGIIRAECLRTRNNVV